MGVHTMLGCRRTAWCVCVCVYSHTLFSYLQIHAHVNTRRAYTYMYVCMSPSNVYDTVTPLPYSLVHLCSSRVRKPVQRLSEELLGLTWWPLDEVKGHTRAGRAIRAWELVVVVGVVEEWRIAFKLIPYVLQSPRTSIRLGRLPKPRWTSSFGRISHRVRVVMAGAL